ncbi:MAG: hypothetical protein KJ063_25315 [Anaerolineae bacterium]|nr:hypothetical protein [Anaerolineae bacterium]
MKKHIPTFAVVAFFAVITVAFFAPVLFTQTTHLPIGTDFVNFNYPHDLFAARSLQQGELPLWNPYLSGGQPLAADPNIGFWYPLRLLLLVTAFSYQTMTYLLIFHYFLAGIFTYALARDLGVGRWGSLVAGMGFMFSGFLIAQMDHINIIFSSTWMPLIFLLFRRAVLRQQLVYALAAGLAWALAVLGGHQQFALFTGYWCGLWLVGHLLHRRGRGVLRSVAAYGVMALVAVAGAAVQIFPTLEFMQFTNRAALSVVGASEYIMPPVGWLLLLSPHLFGQNHIESLPFWPPNLVFVNEFYAYVGVVILFAAFIGSYVWKSWEKRFLLFMIVLGFVLTLGAVTPVYRLAYQMVPGMQFVRVPGRFVFWVDTSLVLLAAFGVDWLLSHLADQDDPLWRDVLKLLGLAAIAGLIMRLVYPLMAVWQVPTSHPLAAAITRYRLADTLAWFGIMAGLLFLLWAARRWARVRAWAPVLLVGLVVFDLFRAQQPRHLTTYDMLVHYEHPAIIQLWRDDPGFFRVDNTAVAALGSKDAFAPEPRWNVLTGFVHGFPQAFGLPWNPFDLQRFSDYRGAVNPDSPFYDFLGVKYLVADPEEALPDKWTRLPVADPTLVVYENSQVLPRAFMVFTSIMESDPEQALWLIQEASFDPIMTVLLEEGEPFTGVEGDAQVEITGMSNNTLKLLVESERPGYLVVSDTYYPGWQVWVNGEEGELLRANTIFRAVFLEGGTATVRFAYESTAVTWGTAVTLLTWCAVAAGIFVLARRRRGD